MSDQAYPKYPKEGPSGSCLLLVAEETHADMPERLLLGLCLCTQHGQPSPMLGSAQCAFRSASASTLWQGRLTDWHECL